MVQSHVNGRKPILSQVESVAWAIDPPQPVAEVAIEVFEGCERGVRGVGKRSEGAGRRDGAVIELVVAKAGPPADCGFVGRVVPGIITGGKAPAIGAVAL